MSTARITRVGPAAAIVEGNAATWGIVLLLTVIGAYLRLANIGALGFRWDEDLSSLAVKAILETGVPELPSGMIYLRGGAFLYMMAASAELFGFSEMSLRLPAALFGIAMIPLAFVFARTLFGTRAGLVTAALLTISIWDIEFSRYARMYAPFAFFYIATVLCIFRFRVQSESTSGGILCVVLAVATISLHDLGYTLVMAFFFPLVIHGSSPFAQPRKLVFPVVASGVVASFFLLWSGLLDRLRELPRASAADDAVEAMAIAERAAEPLSTLLPNVPLLIGFAETAPGLLAIFAGGLLAAAAWFAVTRLQRPLDRLILVMIAAFCAVQLFNLALLGTFMLAFFQREGLAAFRRPALRFAVGLVAVAFFAWLGAAAAFDLAASEGAQGVAGEVKATVKALLNFPHFFVFWGFPNEWPLASIPAGIGILWAFDRAARSTPDRAGLFLILALLTPLFCNGLFDTQYQLFRYDVPFSTLFFAFVALGLTRWGDVLASVRVSGGERSSSRGGASMAGTVLLVGCVLLFDLNPLRGWLATQRDYREQGALYRAFGMQRYVDFKTPAGYVESHAANDDIILALDPREYYNYVGRLDYSVMSDAYEPETYVDEAGKRRDLYLSTPLIMDLATLREVLNVPDRAKWLIASDGMIAQTPYLDEDLKSFLLSQQERVVYVGRDGDTRVYRFD